MFANSGSRISTCSFRGIPLCKALFFRWSGYDEYQIHPENFFKPLLEFKLQDAALS